MKKEYIQPQSVITCLGSEVLMGATIGGSPMPEGGEAAAPERAVPATILRY